MRVVEALQPMSQVVAQLVDALLEQVEVEEQRHVRRRFGEKEAPAARSR